MSKKKLNKKQQGTENIEALHVSSEILSSYIDEMGTEKITDTEIDNTEVLEKAVEEQEDETSDNNIDTNDLEDTSSDKTTEEKDVEDKTTDEESDNSVSEDKSSDEDTNTENLEDDTQNKGKKKRDKKEKTKTDKKHLGSNTKKILIGLCCIGIFICIIIIGTVKNKGGVNQDLTADYLMQTINTLPNTTYSDVRLNIDIQVTPQDAPSSKVEMITDMEVQSDEDTQHSKGSISTTIYGMTGNVDTETWQDKINTYTYNQTTEKWTVDMNQTGMVDITKILNAIQPELFTEYKLEDYTKDDVEYAITGKIQNDSWYSLLENLVSADNPAMNYNLGSIDDIFKNAEYQVMLVFDRSTEALHYIQFSLEDETDNVFKFIVEIHELSTDKQLDIPDEVKANTEFTEEPNTEEETKQDVAKTIAQEYFSTEFVDIATLVEKSEGLLKEEDGLVTTIQTLVNQYSQDDLMLLASTWGRLDEDIRQGIAFIYYKGWINKTKFDELGIDAEQLKESYIGSEINKEDVEDTTTDTETTSEDTSENIDTEEKTTEVTSEATTEATTESTSETTEATTETKEKKK